VPTLSRAHEQLVEFPAPEEQSDPLGWIGADFVVLVTGVWAAIVYFFPPQKLVDQKPANIEVN
jgi:hypothetical protein